MFFTSRMSSTTPRTFICNCKKNIKLIEIWTSKIKIKLSEIISMIESDYIMDNVKALSVHYMHRNLRYIQLAFKYFVPESIKSFPIRFGGVCLWWKLIPPSVFRGNIFDNFVQESNSSNCSGNDIHFTKEEKDKFDLTEAKNFLEICWQQCFWMFLWEQGFRRWLWWWLFAWSISWICVPYTAPHNGRLIVLDFEMKTK